MVSPEFSLLDENLEQPALDFKAGLMDERLDLVGEVLVLLWHGQRHPQRQIKRQCLPVILDGAEGDGSLKAVGGTHGVSPYWYYVLWWSILVLWGSIPRVFLSIGQGKSLPRRGISPENIPPILCIFPLCRAPTGERQEEFLNP